MRSNIAAMPMPVFNAGIGFPSFANFDPATGDGAENGCTNLRAFDADMTQSLDVVFLTRAVDQLKVITD